MKQSFLSTLLVFVFLASAYSGWTQSNNPVMLQVAGENITKNEFLNVFEKNSPKGEKPDDKALEEYLDLFINFRLKVAEAKSLGMDTLKSFRDELSGYRKQLAGPFLVDNDASDKMIAEAYEHMKYDVRASHILIRVDKLASAADTLAAWNKIMKLRKRILAGEDFGKVAAEASDDASAQDREQEGQKIKGNRGDLGFFTALDMVYPFEKAAYDAKLNEVSMPIRTDYGFHLIKTTDKVPSQGKVQLAHIMLVIKPKATLDDSLRVADSANMAYKLISGGADFGDIAKKFSDDLSTASKGGLLPWFGVSRMLPEFVNQIKFLKQKGQYSEPFQTPFGWHIIKLVDRKPIGSFEDEKDELKKSVTRNDRANTVTETFIAKTKIKYGFTTYPGALDELTARVTDSIFNASWKANEVLDLTKPLFTIGTSTYTQYDFAKNLATTQRKTTPINIPAYVNQQYVIYANDAVLQYADSQLETENPDFKALVGEYHDGILLFDLTDKKVWTKAVKDTIGLQAFYETAKNNYLWDSRLDASIFTVKDPSILKKVRKQISKGYTDEKILATFNKDSIQKVTVERKKFIKGENMTLENVAWQEGISANIPLADNEVAIIKVHKVVAPEPKLLNEVRGLMTADYQNYLEKEWIKELRSKYPVVVNRAIFDSIPRK